MDDPRRRELLLTLDETPQTPEALARTLGRPVEEVESALAAAAADRLAVDWGGVWATTWRAKVRIVDPGFFRVWVPASLAAGAAVTVVATALHGPGEARAWLPVLGGIAGVSLGWAVTASLRARRAG